ncbi:MAG TPA: TIGR04282 family arsenosugar biosynthesis glycosyltransferase [Pyrinomonadaceae bacterium]|nr:TIGR04282 family arsenosugar biosynthesis glycosyltransferase [Pyrinomonadaceae bacterium]
MRAVIIVMVKAPLPGLAKTRLTPPLDQSEAASLALCFVQDVVNSALEITQNVVVAFTPPDGRAVLEASLPDGLRWIEQQGQHLGDRLISAIAYAYDLGFSPIILLGADSPTLPPVFIQQACQMLTVGSADVALGPAADGGYYLLGVRKPEPGLFQNITWSSPFTLEHTIRNINQLGLRLVTLDQWYDVDTFAELQTLDNELRSDERARSRAPATYSWLLAHNLTFRND